MIYQDVKSKLQMGYESQVQVGTIIATSRTSKSGYGGVGLDRSFNSERGYLSDDVIQSTLDEAKTVLAQLYELILDLKNQRESKKVRIHHLLGLGQLTAGQFITDNSPRGQFIAGQFTEGTINRAKLKFESRN